MMRRALVVVLGVLTGGVFGLAFVVNRFGQQERKAKAEAIVVLGARVLEGGVASSALRARVERGVALYREGLAPLLLFSGGVGTHPPSEAAVSRKLALAAGVPEAACVLEEESHSTEQNAQFTARLLRERGIRSVVLVSDPYHLLRASRYFRREGVIVHPSPALLSERNIHWLDRWYWTLREAMALVISPSLWWISSP